MSFAMHLDLPFTPFRSLSLVCSYRVSEDAAGGEPARGSGGGDCKVRRLLILHTALFLITVYEISEDAAGGETARSVGGGHSKGLWRLSHVCK